MGRAEIILHPRMGGHCVVTRNGPAYYLGTEMVEDGPAGGRVFFFDDELEQLHGGVRQASSGFDDKEDGQVLWVLCEVSEDRPTDTELVCSRSGSAGPRRRQEWLEWGRRKGRAQVEGCFVAEIGKAGGV